MKNSTKILKAPGGLLKPDQLREFLLAHLNRIYCAKAHLHERLPELAEQADFKDLKHAILETWEDIGKQMARIEEIYVLLDDEASLANCDELIQFVETGFTAICQQSAEPGLRDLSILFYLSIIESIELASFRLLQMATINMPDKQIKQLLQENFDESKADRILFRRITAVYIGEVTLKL